MESVAQISRDINHANYVPARKLMPFRYKKPQTTAPSTYNGEIVITQGW